LPPPVYQDTPYVVLENYLRISEKKI